MKWNRGSTTFTPRLVLTVHPDVFLNHSFVSDHEITLPSYLACGNSELMLMMMMLLMMTIVASAVVRLCRAACRRFCGGLQTIKHLSLCSSSLSSSFRFRDISTNDLTVHYQQLLRDSHCIGQRSRIRILLFFRFKNMPFAFF